jgi:flagellar basal-body rod modification protein FlgD
MAVSSVQPYQTVDTSVKTNTSKTEMDKEAFLKLLILQLQNQDPLEPLKNEQFIAQLAQFNSLEQMQNLNTTMGSLSKIQTLSDTASLVGKKVVANDSEGNQIQGQIGKVLYENGAARIAVYDTAGTEYETTVDNILALA